MKELLESVENTTCEELARSYKNYPKFNSPHEGWAVILEEADEHTEDCGKIDGLMQAFWKHIMSNDFDAQIKTALMVKEAAIHASAEAIQTAAMAQKFIDSVGDKP